MPLRSAISSVPQRWIVCALCSWALAIVSFKDSCFHEIGNIVYSVSETKTTPTEGCPFLYSGCPWERRAMPFSLPVIYWSPHIIEIANSAFIFGKLLTVIPAGVLSDLGYSRYVLGGGMFLVGAKHLVFPTTSSLGVIVFAVENILEGIGDAFIFSSVFSLLSRWTPPAERNALIAIVVAGLFYGDTLGHVFFKLIYMGLSSWSAGQYLTGLLALVWLALGYVFIYHAPDESPYTTSREFHAFHHGHRRSLKTSIVRLQWIPWRKIVTSRAFLSLVLLYCSLDWGVKDNILFFLDSYQTSILHLPYSVSNATSIAIITAVPSLLMGGFLIDWVIKHSFFSNIALKKTLVFISIFGSTLLLVIAVCLVGCNIVLFWVLVITAIYTLGLGVSVVYSVPIDISPRHAGLLTGIMVAVRSFFTIFGQGLDRFLMTDNYNRTEWLVMCLTFAAVAVAMMIPFLFFGSGDHQRWVHANHGRPSRTDDQPPVELEIPAESNTQ